MAARTLSLIVTEEWIDGNNVQRSLLGNDTVNLSFAEELYGTILRFFLELCRQMSDLLDISNKASIRDALNRLHLWGRDICNGNLATVLTQSDDLRDDVVGLLIRIGKQVIRTLLRTLIHYEL